MSEETNEVTMRGQEITLASGASVALFVGIEPGANLLLFTNAAGDKTPVKLSDEALQAVAALIVKQDVAAWRATVIA